MEGGHDKLFGSKRGPKPVPAYPVPEAPKPESVFRTPWFQVLLTCCVVLLIAAVVFECYRRLENRGQRIVESKPVEARIEFANSPDWLAAPIINRLLEQAVHFSTQDQETFNRVRNVLDADVIREMADIYTGSHIVNGAEVRRQSVSFNAWIKRINKVERDVARDKSSQTIRVYAEFRQPAVWIRSNNSLYLIDTEGVRLPGTYQLSDRGSNALLVVAGVDLPQVAGKPAIPEPGQSWTFATDGTLAADLQAAMKLAPTLQKHNFAKQIAAIDMTNFNGRRDAQTSWILLETPWREPDGSLHVIRWGRPLGEEKFYEVKAAKKIERLDELLTKFSRIDAGLPYVDIRMDWMFVPNAAPPAPSPPPTRLVRG